MQIWSRSRPGAIGCIGLGAESPAHCLCNAVSKSLGALSVRRRFEARRRVSQPFQETPLGVDLTHAVAKLGVPLRGHSP